MTDIDNGCGSALMYPSETDFVWKKICYHSYIPIRMNTTLQQRQRQRMLFSIQNRFCAIP